VAPNFSLFNMDLSNGPSTKRKRSDFPEFPHILPPNQVDDLWFNDGSIVLQAEITQFRVHRSVLSANSDIFQDMFSVPQPSEQGEQIEGCPVVHLPDSAKDWTHVLRALYDFRYQIQLSCRLATLKTATGDLLIIVNHFLLSLLSSQWAPNTR